MKPSPATRVRPVVHAVEKTGLELWTEQGRKLGKAVSGLQWMIGDWWNGGASYGPRVAIVKADDWDGPCYRTCRNAGAVAACYPVSRRRDTLSFTHHAEVAALSPDQRRGILDWAEKIATETGKPPATRLLRDKVREAHSETRRVPYISRGENIPVTPEWQEEMRPGRRREEENKAAAQEAARELEEIVAAAAAGPAPLFEAAVLEVPNLLNQMIDPASHMAGWLDKVLLGLETPERLLAADWELVNRTCDALAALMARTAEWDANIRAAMPPGNG